MQVSTPRIGTEVDAQFWRHTALAWTCMRCSHKRRKKCLGVCGIGVRDRWGILPVCVSLGIMRTSSSSSRLIDEFQISVHTSRSDEMLCEATRIDSWVKESKMGTRNPCGRVAAAVYW